MLATFESFGSCRLDVGEEEDGTLFLNTVNMENF